MAYNLPSPTMSRIKGKMLTSDDLSAGEERRLQRALRHVSTHWIPINRDHYYKIMDGLNSGKYDLSPEFLMQDLKADIGLLTLCLRELGQAAKKEYISEMTIADPVALITWGGAKVIKDILLAVEIPNSHEISKSTELQAARLRESLLAASATETLAEHTNLEPNKSYTHSIIRQLGMNLIAWNYPTLYERVVAHLSDKTTLEDALTRELGFSPTLLASSMISQDCREFEELCEIGESLARANQPDLYPQAEADWESAKKHIFEKLGENGINLIKQKVISNTQVYRETFPVIFESLSNLNPEESIYKHKRNSVSPNPYLKFCAPHIRQLLKDASSSLPNGKIDRISLENLLKNISQKAGFSGVLIYLLDPTRTNLDPIFRFGKITLRTVESVQWQQPFQTSTLVSEWNIQREAPPSDLVTAAFVCDIPIVERNISGEPGFASLGIYGSLGKDRRVGVLYLEVPTELAEASPTLALNTYKAIRHALCDSLSLR